MNELLTQTKKTIDLRLDVSGSSSLKGPIEMAVSVFLPSAENLINPPVVIFAVPGGGYSRAYFDLHFLGHVNYSEAEHHTHRGIIFVACDHIGVGDSSLPDPSALTFEILAATYDAGAQKIIERIEKGTISEHFPPVSNPFKIGIGQSMGGCVTILTQAQHRTFAGIAILGFSGIHTVLPQPTENQKQAALATFNFKRNTDLRNLSISELSTLPDFVYPFYWEDVPADIVKADMKGGYPIRKVAPPWGSATLPSCVALMMSPGIIAEEAAAINVPVLIGMGERDVCPVPHAEPSAYKNSKDVSLYIVPTMAHMHNFASTRELLWDRIAGWCQIIAQQTVRPI